MLRNQTGMMTAFELLLLYGREDYPSELLSTYVCIHVEIFVNGNVSKLLSCFSKQCEENSLLKDTISMK